MGKCVEPKKITDAVSLMEFLDGYLQNDDRLAPNVIYFDDLMWADGVLTEKITSKSALEAIFCSDVCPIFAMLYGDFLHVYCGESKCQLSVSSIKPPGGRAENILCAELNFESGSVTCLELDMENCCVRRLYVCDIEYVTRLLVNWILYWCCSIHGLLISSNDVMQVRLWLSKYCSPRLPSRCRGAGEACGLAVLDEIEPDFYQNVKELLSDGYWFGSKLKSELEDYGWL